MKKIIQCLAVILFARSVYAANACLLSLTPPTLLTSICQDTAGNIQFTDSATGPINLSALGASSTGIFPSITASSATFGNASATSFGNNSYVVMNSSGSSQNLTLNVNGQPSGGLQNKIGGLTINSLTGPPATDFVIHDNTLDNQAGTGLLEIWEDRTTSGHNDPLIWVHDNGNASNPIFRGDSYAPDFEMVNLSTDNAHGLGKFEPFAIAYQGINLQVNSRAYDNSTFETMADWTPLSMGGGLTLYPTSLANDSAVITSTSTVPLNWLTLNSHVVGIRGPDNTAASWTFRLPSTFANGGQVLYQASSSAPRNWEFTTGGTAGNSLNFTSTSSAPAWGTPQLTSQTKAQIAAIVPSAVGQMYYCSDCTTLRTCVSTGTVTGAFSSPVSATTACN